MSKRLKVATVFSGGFGSMEFALKGYKHKQVFACEIDEKARESYLNNHKPPKIFYKDVHGIKGSKYKKLNIDYIHCSPPCQSYSALGNRKGLKDERGGLMFTTIKLLSEAQPKSFSIENVRGLLTVNKGKDWSEILEDMKKLLPNYKVHYRLVNSLDLGTPQSRNRVFIVGFRKDAIEKPFRWNFKKRPLKFKMGELLEEDVRLKYVLTSKKVRYYKRAKRAVKAYRIESTNYVGTVLASYHKRGTDAHRVKCKKRRSSKKGSFKSCERYFTPRECSRFMGDFEDNFKFGELADTHLYKVIGNAIELETAKYIVDRVLRVISNE